MKLFELKSLKSLSIYRTRIDSIPVDIKNLVGLRRLSTDIKKISPAIGELKQLKVLNVTKVPTFLSKNNLESLEEISCNNKEFPNWLFKLKKIKSIYICGMKNKSFNVAQTDLIPSLEKLNVNGKVNSQILSKLISLKYLSINDLNIDLKALQNLTSLNELYISEIYDPFLLIQAVSQLPKLERLEITPHLHYHCDSRKDAVCQQESQKSKLDYEKEFQNQNQFFPALKFVGIPLEMKHIVPLFKEVPKLQFSH